MFPPPPPVLHGGGAVFLGSGCFRALAATTAGVARVAGVEFVGQGTFSSGVSLNLFMIFLNFAACAGFAVAGLVLVFTVEDVLRGVCRYGET